MHGFLLLDKPKGLPSFSLVRSLRKILNIRRIGYAGTLDPLATGLMILAVGEATKLLHFLEGLDKKYDVTIRLGATSETYDSEGPIMPVDCIDRLSEEVKNMPRSRLEEILEEHFSGERDQRPPAYSAVKIGGKRAYALARKGESVVLPSRKISFYDLQVQRFAYPLLECSVHCSSGTYIRTFAHDLGQILGCGGYVESLRRTKIGSFLIQDAVPFDQITPLNVKTFIQKPHEFLKDWQQYHLKEDEYQKLSFGAAISCAPAFTIAHSERSSTPPLLALFQDECVGILEPVKSPGASEKPQLKFAKKFNIV